MPVVAALRAPPALRRPECRWWRRYGRRIAQRARLRDPLVRGAIGSERERAADDRRRPARRARPGARPHRAQRHWGRHSGPPPGPGDDNATGAGIPERRRARSPLPGPGRRYQRQGRHPGTALGAVPWADRSPWRSHPRPDAATMPVSSARGRSMRPCGAPEQPKRQWDREALRREQARAAVVSERAGQQAKTDQHFALRSRWSSSTSSRISSGSWSRCHWHSRRPASWRSPSGAAARAARIA